MLRRPLLATGNRVATLLLFATAIGATAFPAHAGILFGGYVDGGSQATSDWSSDLGLDYVANSNGVGNVGGQTTPKPWTAGSIHTSDSVTMHVFRDFGSGSYTEASDTVTIGASGALMPSVIHTFHIDNRLSVHLGGYGVFNLSSFGGTFYFGGVTAAIPLYWYIAWNITVTNGGTADFLTGVEVIHGDPGYTLNVSGPLSASGTTSGSAFGSVAFNTFTFDDGFGLGGRSTIDESRMIADVRIAFSDTPFNSIPGVPEPSTVGLFAIGLAGVTTMARKRPTST